MQENMFTGKVFYKAAFCIVGPVHFFNVILLSYAIIIHLGIVHYWAATTLLLLIVGILSNALTIKYLAQRICKNRHFYLWILILFVLTSEQCLVSLRIVLLLYPNIMSGPSYQIFKIVSQLRFVVHYFDCVKFVAVTEIAFLRFIKCLTGKSLKHRIWKIFAIFMPFIVATVDFTVEAVLYERKKTADFTAKHVWYERSTTTELTDKLLVEYNIRVIFVVIAIIATLLAAAFRYIRKLNEQLEFSSTCFLTLFFMSTYEVIFYLLYKNIFWKPMKIYQFDQWKLVFFAIYGLVMFYTDNNYKKAVQWIDQVSLEPQATESEFQLLPINQQDYF